MTANVTGPAELTRPCTPSRTGRPSPPYDPAACVSPDSLAAVVASVLDAPADVDITEIALQPPPRS